MDSFKDVKVFEDPANWQQNRLPCKADRIIFPETGNVLINSHVKAKELVLPYNGAIIFGENAKVELFENEADASCPGEDLLFTGAASSHWTHDTSALSLGRLLFNFIVVLLLLAFVYAVYLNQTRGMGVNEMVTMVTTNVRNVSGRLSRFYVQGPTAEGTFNFIRFQGDDDNIELELGSQQMQQQSVSRSGQPVAVGEAATEGSTGSTEAPTKPARSLRGLGFMMSDIAEVEEEGVDTESEDMDATDAPENKIEEEVVEEEPGVDSDQKLLLFDD